jgi:lipopolysaccharide transport system permease protein
MLGVYTFVFSVVFGSKWGVAGSDSQAGFALTAFAGLVVFNIFSECVNRSPYMILGSANYVKKVVFPLQVLPASLAVSSLLVAGISTLILLAASALVAHGPRLTLLAFPLVVLPVALMGLGLGWFLASLAVFLRDVCQMVGVVTQVIFFATPVFFPVSMIRQPYRTVIMLNPLTHVVDAARRTLLWGLWPEWPSLLAVTLAAAAVAQLGYAWFMRSKRSFADVI